MTIEAKGLDSLMERLEGFNRLPDMVNVIIDHMTALGEKVAKSNVTHIDTGRTRNSVTGYREGNVGYVIAGGAAVWLEFGTGVRHNTPAGSSPHPKGEALGMTIGTYGEGHGADPNGWWYYKDGELRHTYGIEADMFMQKAADEMKRAFPEYAREAFR